MTTIQPIKNLSVSRNDKTDFSSNLIGRLEFDKLTDTSGVVSILCRNVDTGLSQTISVPDVADFVDAPFVLDFDLMGFAVKGQTDVDYSCPIFTTVNARASIIADSICNSSTNLRLRAAIPVDVTIPFGTSTLPSKSAADLSLGDYQGWVLYREPTQTELTADSTQPNNMWQSYVGDWNEIPQLNSALLTRIKADKSATLTMTDGTEIPKFDYVWSNYSIIDRVKQQKKFDGTVGTAIFTFVNELAVLPTRLNVYLNGIYQPNTKISIDKNVVDCSNLNPAVGDTITAILEAYTPSKLELAFDPSLNPVKDNPIQLIQYKYDYQYTAREIRNQSGELVNTLYYFWVANKNLTTLGRSVSLQSAKSLLKVNTNPYAILQNINPINGIPSYNRFIGMGLNRYITQDDTYKVRFTRDFVLRDDPRDTELKNVHTEWALIREEQNNLIPEQLWNILVDAACGVNIIGEPIPSLSRVAYDERNGTATRYGFGAGQVFVDQALALSSIKYAIANTALTSISAATGGVEIPDPISFIDPSTLDELFATQVSSRKTLNDIWTKAKPKQVNEIFFTVLYDALAENYEFSDIFKTSMIAAHSIRLFSSFGLGQ
jgi:hypothetical protein